VEVVDAHFEIGNTKGKEVPVHLILSVKTEGGDVVPVAGISAGFLRDLMPSPDGLKPALTADGKGYQVGEYLCRNPDASRTTIDDRSNLAFFQNHLISNGYPVENFKKADGSCKRAYVGVKGELQYVGNPDQKSKQQDGSDKPWPVPVFTRLVGGKGEKQTVTAKDVGKVEDVVKPETAPNGKQAEPTTAPAPAPAAETSDADLEKLAKTFVLESVSDEPQDAKAVRNAVFLNTVGRCLNLSLMSCWCMRTCLTNSPSSNNEASE